MDKELKDFISKEFSNHTLKYDEYSDKIKIYFKNPEGRISPIYAQVYFEDDQYIFYLNGSLVPKIAGSKDFEKFKAKVLNWSQFLN